MPGYKSGLAILFSLLLMAPSIGWALKTDREQPVHLEANSVEIDEKQGVSTYEGNVVVTQGSLQLTGDKMNIYRQNGKLSRILSQGNPSRYRQRMDNSEEEVKGSAKQIELKVHEDELLLTGDAHLEQGKNQFSSDRIQYLRSQAMIKAGNNGESNQRVKVTIEPQQEGQ